MIERVDLLTPLASQGHALVEKATTSRGPVGVTDRQLFHQHRVLVR